MGFLIGFGAFLGVVLVYLLVIIFAPVLRVEPCPIELSEAEHQREWQGLTGAPLSFEVEGVTVRARLYLPPEGGDDLLCVVMSHGLGGTQDAACERYIRRFTEAGLAVLTYDYRHFGESEGEPRQLYSGPGQLEDLRGAVACARAQASVDPDKIVLWGTSAGGGYGIIVAAEDHRIAGVVAQCAALDHDADGKLFIEREGYLGLLRWIPHLQRDKGRMRFGLSPHSLPIVGPPGSAAMLRAPGAYEGYARLVKGSRTFRNEIVARSLGTGHTRDVVEASADVRCPVLMLSCELDNLAHPEGWRRPAEALGDKATVKTWPIDHFQIYEGEHLERAVAEMLAFMRPLRETSR